MFVCGSCSSYVNIWDAMAEELKPASKELKHINISMNKIF